MKAKINGNGWLIIQPETDLEHHQIEKWCKENQEYYSSECKITSVEK